MQHHRAACPSFPLLPGRPRAAERTSGMPKRLQSRGEAGDAVSAGMLAPFCRVSAHPPCRRCRCRFRSWPAQGSGLTPTPPTALQGCSRGRVQALAAAGAAAAHPVQSSTFVISFVIFPAYPPTTSWPSFAGCCHTCSTARCTPCRWKPSGRKCPLCPPCWRVRPSRGYACVHIRRPPVAPK